MKKTLWPLLLASLLLIGVVGVCWADTPPQGPPPDSAKMETELKNVLDQLVSSQVITAKQETAILDYLKKNAPKKPTGTPPAPGSKPAGGARPSMFEQLVKDGVITSEQASAIEAKMPKPAAPPQK